MVFRSHLIFVDDLAVLALDDGVCREDHIVLLQFLGRHIRPITVVPDASNGLAQRSTEGAGAESGSAPKVDAAQHGMPAYTKSERAPW